MGLLKIIGLLLKNNSKYIFYGIAGIILIYICVMTIRTSATLESQVQFNEQSSAQLKALGNQVSNIDEKVRNIGQEQQRVAELIDKQQQDRKNEITTKSRSYRERILNGELQFSAGADRGASTGGGGGIVDTPAEFANQSVSAHSKDAGF